MVRSGDVGQPNARSIRAVCFDGWLRSVPINQNPNPNPPSPPPRSAQPSPIPPPTTGRLPRTTRPLPLPSPTPTLPSPLQRRHFLSPPFSTLAAPLPLPLSLLSRWQGAATAGYGGDNARRHLSLPLSLSLSSLPQCPSLPLGDDAFSTLKIRRRRRRRRCRRPPRVDLSVVAATACGSGSGSSLRRLSSSSGGGGGVGGGRGWIRQQWRRPRGSDDAPWSDSVATTALVASR